MHFRSAVPASPGRARSPSPQPPRQAPRPPPTTDDVAPGPAQQLPPVQVHGNYDNAVGSTDAASEGTVTAKLIESRPTLRPAEVLEFVPGVIVTQHSGDGKANQYFLRGFNLDHGTDFATFVDGMPVNMPTHAHGQGYTDLNWLIPELVERFATARARTTRRKATSPRPASARIDLFDALPRGIACADARQDRYRARPARRLARARRAAAALCARSAPTTTGPGRTRRSSIAGQRRAALELRQRRRAAPPSPRWATRRGWNATDQIPQRAVDAGLIGRFGAHRPERRRRAPALQPVVPDASARSTTASSALNAYAIRSQLDLFSNFTYFLEHPIDLDRPDRRRPVRAGRAAHVYGAGGEPQLERAVRRGSTRSTRSACRCATTASIRSACTPRCAAQRAATTQESACARPASACTPRTRRSGRRGSAASPACAPIAIGFDVDSSIPANSGSANDGIV